MKPGVVIMLNKLKQIVYVVHPGFQGLDRICPLKILPSRYIT